MSNFYGNRSCSTDIYQYSNLVIRIKVPPKSPHEAVVTGHSSLQITLWRHTTRPIDAKSSCKVQYHEDNTKTSSVLFIRKSISTWNVCSGIDSLCSEVHDARSSETIDSSVRIGGL